VPVHFIGPETRERRWSGSNRRRLGVASRHDGFVFDSAPRGRGNEGAEPGEGVERRRKLSSVRSRAEEVARGARHGGAGQRRRRLGRDRGRRNPRVGRHGMDWAALAGLQLGRFRNFQRKGVGMPW
jgi:hypothetical protein